MHNKCYYKQQNIVLCYYYAQKNDVLMVNRAYIIQYLPLHAIWCMHQFVIWYTCDCPSEGYSVCRLYVYFLLKFHYLLNLLKVYKTAHNSIPSLHPFPTSTAMWFYFHILQPVVEGCGTSEKEVKARPFPRLQATLLM